VGGVTATAPSADVTLERGVATLLASWREDAKGSRGAAFLRLEGVDIGVFPSDPERAFFNNALFHRDMDRSEREAAIAAMSAAYDEAGVDRYAAWVHESDEPMRAELEGRGYEFTEATRAMGMGLDDRPPMVDAIEVEPLSWGEYVAHLQSYPGVPAGLLGDATGEAYHVLGVRQAGDVVAAAIAFDLHGDCGIFNMATIEAARRRGLATALTARHLHDAAARGLATASLQATLMAERVYAAAGFHDLGRFLEFAPPSRK
jgi:ribosomal protein S18 acetylase RimI-like enzyme